MFLNHYRTMLYKDYLLIKKSWIGFLLSIAFPVLLMVLLVILRKTTDFETHDKQSLSDVDRDLLSPNVTFLQEFYQNKAYKPFSQCYNYISQGMDLRYSIISDDTDFTDILNNKIQEFTKLSGGPSSFKLKEFDSESDLIDYVKDSDYIDTPKICFAVILKKNSNWKLKFRFNFTESIPEDYQKIGKYIPIFDLSEQNFAVEDYTTAPTEYQQQFIESGFLPVLNFYDNYIYQEVYKQEGSIETYMLQIPFRKYTEDGFNNVIRQTLPFFIILANLIPVARLVTQLVTEKEERIKELMLIMGLSSKAYWLSIFSFYFVYYTLIALLESIILSFGDVLQYSDFGVIFLLFWLFGLTCIALCFMISTFFSKSKSAVIFTVMLFLVLYVLNFSVDDPKIALNSKLGASIVNTISLSLMCGVFADLELGQIGVTASNVSNIYSNYSFSYFCIFMLIDFCAMMILAWYFSHVIPGEWGINQPWYFLFSPKYWRGRGRKVTNHKLDQKQTVENFEDIDIGLTRQVESGQALAIRDLVKTFKSKTVVDNINLDIFEGQIFALLGHNGAGKTTTISMLTGLIPVTQGDVIYNDACLSNNIDGLRKFIGLCPQQNVLFGNLTAYEHLYIFSRIKGQTDKQLIDEEIEKLLRELGIPELSNKPSRFYSGGQKRKLCLAMALISNSKIVLLDEPTSGMDLTARRKMWDMLKNQKQGKIIILTTHYMEEADVLADRIAILSQGKVKCCGSPLFLKNRYGAGFYLKLLKTQDIKLSTSSSKIEKFFNKYLPQAKLISDIQAEITFQVPRNISEDLKGFFDRLDKRLEKLGLLSYGISVTTLEEVFLQVAKEEEKKEVKEVVQEDENSPMNIGFKLENDREVKGKFTRDFKELTRKRLIMTRRDKKSICMEIMIPIGLVLVGLLVRFNKPVLPVFDQYLMTIDKYSTPQKVMFGFETVEPVISELDYTKLTFVPGKGLEEFTELLEDSWDVSPKRMGSYHQSDNLELNVLNNQTSIESPGIFYSAYSAELIRQVDPDYNVKVYNHPFPPTHDMDDISFLGDGFIGSLLVGMGCTFIPVGVIGLVMKEKELNIKHQHVISGMSIWSYWMSYFLWDIIKHILPTIGIPVLTIIFNLESFVDKDIKIAAQFVLIYIFGFAVFPFTYLSTFFFSKFSTAQYATIGLHFLTGCALPSALYVMLFYDSLRETVKVLVWIFKIFPNFCLGWGVMNIGSGKNIAALYELDEEMNPFDINSAGGDILILCIIFLLSSIFLIYAEYRSANPNFSSSSSTSQEIDLNILDDDVAKEYKKAVDANPQEVKINVQNISKFFNSFRAVNGVGFNVEDGECFALLGVNGAGKTTTFKMLTGEVKPSQGKIFIGGTDLTVDQSRARMLIGYCPQFDCLNDTLSVEEHLKLYGALKGIPREILPKIVEETMQSIDLTKYRKQLAGKLSGGNKRKLSVGIALIGNPTAILLDEPSAGMDPQARKKMWKVLGKVKQNNAAIIITTHSMEEAEALSDRMAIMVSGSFKCIGSASWIKNKFGEGYELEVKINPPSDEKIQKMLEVVKDLDMENDLKKVLEMLKSEYLSEVQGFSNFLNGFRGDSYDQEKKIFLSWVCIEKRGHKLKKWLLDEFGHVQEVEHFLSYYKFNIKKQNIQLGSLFSEIQSKREFLNISEYSISQTSLDQIFDNFARSGQQ